MSFPFKQLAGVFSAVSVLSLGAPGFASEFADHTDCGMPGVSVSFSAAEDGEIACEGIRRARRFFEEQGLRPEGEIRITMEDEVLEALLDPSTGELISMERVYGSYHADTGRIRVSSWGTEYLKNRTAFEYLAVTKDLHTSVVAHEVSHRLYDLLMKSLGKEVQRATTEFLAYVVQIATLEGDKEAVLALWPGAMLRSRASINLIMYGAAVHRFGVMSYRYHLEDEEILGEILRGEFRTVDDFFLM